MEGAQWLLNAALTANPVGLIIAGIVLLIALIGYVIYKTDGWGKMWKQVVTNAKLNWELFTTSIKYMWESVTNNFMIGLNKIKSGWYEFKNAVGLGNQSENDSALKQIADDTKKRQDAIAKAKAENDKATAAAKSGVKNAFNNLSWNNKSLGDIVGGVKKKIEKVAGIEKPKLPGVDLDNSALGDDDKDKKKSKTNEAIATGGQRHNYITINLKDLIGVLNIYGKNFNEGSNQMQQQTEDALVRVLAMATTAGI
ncbi:hypothetical protein EIB75_10620 [Epilithonimonas vandammei]|uniref:Phage tail tape measure protein n=1 Tax=Epilithonimonas vandammei TaxID=2487072 RepID=A0A3G8ZP00_9FLAO|nr:hypothetical protein [Epilithonimonas vandammei]AZI55676.1 hypothetical protein EIB75_10620 [Epilithonimonas vandammei]